MGNPAMPEQWQGARSWRVIHDTLGRSSVAERLTVDQMREGSNPSAPALPSRLRISSVHRVRS